MCTYLLNILLRYILLAKKYINVPMHGTVMKIKVDTNFCDPLHKSVLHWHSIPLRSFSLVGAQFSTSPNSTGTQSHPFIVRPFSTLQ